MSDDATPQKDPAEFTVTITFNARTGVMNIEGPLDQGVLCYGILEQAKDLVRVHGLKKNQQRPTIVRPPGVLPPEFRRS